MESNISSNPELLMLWSVGYFLNHCLAPKDMVCNMYAQYQAFQDNF